MRSRSEELLPWYTRLWNWCKQFPAILATGASTPPETAGMAAAALISAAIGAVIMMVTHHLTHTSVDIEQFIEWFGSWIPGSRNTDPVTGNIGTYAGIQTVLLIGWLVSWVIHPPRSAPASSSQHQNDLFWHLWVIGSRDRDVLASAVSVSPSTIITHN